MMLEWKHTENGDTTFLQIPIKMKNTTTSSSGLGGKMMCNSCGENVERAFICKECGLIHLAEGNKKETDRLKHKTDSLLKGLPTYVGKIEKRKDKTTGKIYNEKDRVNFMSFKTDENIKVEHEISFQDVIDNFYFIDSKSVYEIYNNEEEKYKALIKKVHNFLHKKSLVLLVNYGYRGNEKAGVIISTKDRIVLIPMRDYRKVKDSLQLDIEVRENKYDNLLQAITESNKLTLHKEFIKAISRGEKIPEKPKEKEEKPKEIEVGFLEGF